MSIHPDVEQERERLARVTERETARRNEFANHIMLSLTHVTYAVEATAPGDLHAKLQQAQQLLLDVHKELHRLATSH